jgi:hypothetical protein
MSSRSTPDSGEFSGLVAKKTLGAFRDVAHLPDFHDLAGVVAMGRRKGQTCLEMLLRSAMIAWGRAAQVDADVVSSYQRIVNHLRHYGNHLSLTEH